jgi:hypothetical protein
MVDRGIKKITIKKGNLPALDFDNIGYIFRYRIISEDKNRTSQWSPINILTDNSISPVSGAISISSTITTAVWGDEVNWPKYDIFVGFDSATPTYHGTSPINTYSVINTGTENIRIVVQVESSKKQLNPNLEVYDSGIGFLV